MLILLSVGVVEFMRMRPRFIQNRRKEVVIFCGEKKKRKKMWGKASVC